MMSHKTNELNELKSVLQQYVPQLLPACYHQLLCKEGTNCGICMAQRNASSDPSNSFGFGLSHREGKINRYSPFPWPQETVVRQPTRARKSLPPRYLKLKVQKINYFSFLVMPISLLFQMDLDEDAAEKFYQKLLKLEKEIRVTIQKTNNQN